MTNAERIAVTMGALAHPRRVEIFDALTRAGADGLSTAALARVVDVEVEAVEEQLRPMIAAGLIQSRVREGQVWRRLCGDVAGGVFSEVADRLAGARRGIARPVNGDAPVAPRAVAAPCAVTPDYDEDSFVFAVEDGQAARV